MITKRIIPAWMCGTAGVVKGQNFRNLQDVASPVDLGQFYSQSGADELVFYDITASSEGRRLFTDVLQEGCLPDFHSLTVGGGIASLEDFDRVLKAGADKVSVNSAAVLDPELISRAAQRYGSQCVVLSVDVKKVGGQVPGLCQGGAGGYRAGRPYLDCPGGSPGSRGDCGKLHGHRRGKAGL